MPFNNHESVPLWLDGEQVTTSLTFDVKSPLTNKTLYPASAASVKDVEAALQSAQTAFESWSKTKASTRRDILLAAADVMLKRRDEFEKYCAEETGSPPMMFGFDFSNSIDHCKMVAGLLQEAGLGSVPNVLEEGRSAMVLKEPYGVVMSIAPWNAPCILGMRSILAAIAMGNSVIFKVSERSPGVMWGLASVLHDAGLPKGVLNTIAHRPEDAAEIVNALVASPTIKKLSFTGSTGTGAKIASVAGKYLKPTIMELGGKASAIICEDADIQQAALGAAVGAFLYSGQICMATERILVHKSVIEKFKPVFKDTLEAVFGQFDKGLILIDEASPQKNKKLIEDALAKGAKLVHGDPGHNADLTTAMKPIVIEHVSEGMDIYYTESFGPTVSLFAVDSDEEALRIANDTEYGLAASVYTEDLRRGLRIAKQIETGAVHINSMSVHDESVLPHGGAKKSGWGRFNGRAGLEEWVRSKVITWKE